MIGIVILTHGLFGEEIFKSAEMILGRQDKVEIISMQAGFSLDNIAGQLEDIINIYSSDSCLVFTDMFGGSPSNISMAFLGSYNIEVVSGVNLPMLLKAFTLRMDSNYTLSQIAYESAKAGQESIKVAGELLNNIS